jgi:serine/threonine-protein kinase
LEVSETRQPSPTSPGTPIPGAASTPNGPPSTRQDQQPFLQEETKPLQRLQRPVTGPAPFPVQGQGQVPEARGSQPAPMPAPNGARHPTPPFVQAAQPIANAFQSQVVPPAYPPSPPYGPPNAPTGQAQQQRSSTGTQPPPSMPNPMKLQTPPHPMAPVAPGSAPRMSNTGTGPAMQSSPAPQPVQQHPQQPQQHPGAMFARPHTGNVPRITVQYPQVGSTLKGQRGTYVVRDVIGSGEFGAVYDCIGPFDQIYALKMVRPSNRPYSEVQAEWAREQSRLFSLRHPNVVYIYDSFEQDHLFYLALERCDHALKDMLGTPMQEGLVLEMTRQLLAAVQFLHDNEVVHDDLHAGNVLITHTDRPTVKISDFGISNELRGMASVRPNVVHHAIMAPEILATGYTSRQSDLYQVGLLLYWMVAGEPAIQMDVPYQELVRQVAEGEPRRRAEQLGTPFGDLIAKMLRRREAFRYASAREVWSELRELPAWKQRNLFPVK